MSELAYRFAHTGTFIAMLESQNLWFSDLRRMNDWDEYTAGFRIVNEIVTEEFPDHSEFLAEISPARMSSAFMVLICSFSLDSDCLSMWRGYGDNGAGAALGYDYNQIETQHMAVRYLEKSAPIQGRVQFFPVMYDEGAFRKRVRQYLEQTVRNLSTADAEQLPGFKDVQLGRLTVALMRLCTLYKNDFFKDERELRGFIEVSDKADPYALKVHKNGFGEAGYHELNTNSFGVPAITEVVLGPRCELSLEAVRAKLIACGLPRVQVRQSRGTYR